MGVRKGSSKTNSAGADANKGKPFQLVNNIYTQDDIVPLSKVEKSKPTEVNNEQCNPEDGEDNNENVNNNNVNVADTDADLLFSPMNSGDDEEEEEDEYLSSVYFGSQYPKRFHHHSILHKNTAVEQRKSSASTMPLNGLLGINDDFWKEVAMTKEESLCYSLETPLESLESEVQKLPLVNESNEEAVNTSFDEFFKEDIGNSMTMESSAANWNEDFKIKLLCYRDGKGNFRLKTEEDSKIGTLNASKNAVTKKSIKKYKNRDKKLLKHAIRRKSGVWEMVNTGVGIREFML